tara:strand:- start:213 stop:866 length:654 start_codon:yes stop_codon:yes gene_type:complete
VGVYDNEGRPQDPAFEAYNIYLSIRAHFIGEGYDITKHALKASMPYAKYKAKQNIVVTFSKLVKKYKKQEVIDMIVANFASGDMFGGMPFDINAIEVYKEWQIRKNKRSYQFKEDLNTIIERMEKDNIEDATVDTSHPLILKLLLGKLITLETVVILDRELNFIDDYSDDLILKDTCKVVSKYKPFVEKNTKNLYLKHLDLINKIARTRNSSNTMLI